MIKTVKHQNKICSKNLATIICHMDDGEGGIKVGILQKINIFQPEVPIGLSY
jgi:hypothetical protein